MKRRGFLNLPPLCFFDSVSRIYGVGFLEGGIEELALCIVDNIEQRDIRSPRVIAERREITHAPRGLNPQHDPGGEYPTRRREVSLVQLHGSFVAIQPQLKLSLAAAC